MVAEWYRHKNWSQSCQSCHSEGLYIWLEKTELCQNLVSSRILQVILQKKALKLEHCRCLLYAIILQHTHKGELFQCPIFGDCSVRAKEDKSIPKYSKECLESNNSNSLTVSNGIKSERDQVFADFCSNQAPQVWMSAENTNGKDSIRQQEWQNMAKYGKSAKSFWIILLDAASLLWSVASRTIRLFHIQIPDGQVQESTLHAPICTQSVFDLWSQFDLNLISLVRQCQGSAKAHETRGENRACTECSSATSRHGLEKPWHDFSKTLRRLYAACHILSYLVISCHILSYEVEWQGSLKKTGPGNPMPNLVPDLGMRERFLAPSKQKPALKRTFGLFEQFEQFWTVWMVWMCLNLWKSKDKTGRSRWHSNAESSRQSHHEPQSSARS